MTKDTEATMTTSDTCRACGAPLAPGGTHWSPMLAPGGGYVCPFPATSLLRGLTSDLTGGVPTEPLGAVTDADPPVAGLAEAIDAIRREYTQARTKHAPLNSGHEAVGVIDEEFTEFKDALYFGVDRRGQPANPKREAVQIAAMALAYVIEAYGSWEFAAKASDDEDAP